MSEEFLDLVPTASNPRVAALYCCRSMSQAFGRPKWPLHLRDDPGRFLSEKAQRMGWRYQAACTLRGAMWAHEQLKRILVADPSDTEADEMLLALERYLSATWGLDAIPASVPDRDAMAKDLAEMYDKKLVWYADYQQQRPQADPNVQS